MKPCLLALDLDGTACNDQSRLGEKTKQALLAARSRGHVVVFASGRRDIDMVSMGDSHRCADYLVLNNGGKLIRTSDGAVLFNELIDAGAACSLITHCLEHNYLLHVVSGMYWAVNRWDEGLQKYVEELGAAPVMYHSLDEVPFDRVEGFMATADMGPICRFIDEQELPLLHVHSEPTCTDIMREGITKWHGLSRLAKLLDIPRERVIAAGDYNNDLDMIRRAGIGVAVQNALPVVKAAADFVTPHDNNHDAVADIVEHFLLEPGCGNAL